MRPIRLLRPTALAIAALACLQGLPAHAENDLLHDPSQNRGVQIRANADGSNNDEGIRFYDNNTAVFWTNQAASIKQTYIGSGDHVYLNAGGGLGTIYLQKDGSNLMTLDDTGINLYGATSISGALTASSFNTGSGTIQTSGSVLAGTVSATSGSLTNLSLSGALTNGSGDVSINDNLSVSGSTNLQGAVNIGGAISNSAGSVSVADNFIVTGTTTTQGLSNTGSFTQVGDANINTTSEGGATTIGGSANTNAVTLRSGDSTIQAANGVNTISGTSNTISGATEINTTVDAATTIGAASNTSTVAIRSGDSTIEAANGVNTISGTSNTISGETGINTTVDAATTIGAAGNTSAVTLRSGASTIELVDGLNTIAGTTTTIGASTGYATVNNLGTGNEHASTNTVGNTNEGSTVALKGGAGYLDVGQAATTLGTASGGTVQTTATTAALRASAGGALASNGTTGTMSVNGGGGYTAYQASQTVAGGASIGNVLTGATYTNQINGNLLVDGNVYINGTLNYVSSNAANTSVVGGASVLNGATGATTGGSAIVLKDTEATHTTVDANGRLATVTGVAAESVASLTLTNGYGETHGIVVTERQTTISGGTRSTSLTLNDNGATFSNSANGQPVQVHGVADGTADFDAVNVRQLRAVKRGLAATTAMANVPMVDSDRRFAFGMGMGSYDGEHATAVALSARPTQNVSVRAGVGHAFSSGGTRGNTTWGVGAAYSW